MKQLRSLIFKAICKHSKLTECLLTHGCVWNPIHLQDEVIFEEDVANNGEQVDQDESQHRGKYDGASITCHTLYYIQQGLFSVYQVK